MSNENSFKDTVTSLFEGMDGFLSAKTVVGDAITVGDTTILPLMDVSFGIGAGAFAGDKKNNEGGGLTGKMTPCALLVISKGTTKLVNIKNDSNLNKVLDLVPDLVNKFAPGFGSDDADDVILTKAEKSAKGSKSAKSAKGTGKEEKAE